MHFSTQNSVDAATSATFSDKSIHLRYLVLYACMFIFYFLFMLLSDQSQLKLSTEFCTAVAIVLHLLLMTCFASFIYWGFFSYRRFILLFRARTDWISKAGKFIPLILLGNWLFKHCKVFEILKFSGVTLIIVAVLAGTDIDKYYKRGDGM